MDYTELLLIFAVLLLSGIGILGCILPVLPGPPISFAAVLLYHFAKGGVFSLTFLIVALGFVVLVTILDYTIPAFATKKFGGSKEGVWGGIIGLVVGLIFSPFGFVSIIICPLLGAVIGDLVAGRQLQVALKSGLGSFIGFLAATVIKLLLSVALTVSLIIKMVEAT
ncbi:MAG: membrane protein [Chitinophagales bacterium]|nr:MAG: membrane protein [Chitinophagales bacterium]